MPETMKQFVSMLNPSEFRDIRCMEMFDTGRRDEDKMPVYDWRGYTG